MIRSLLVGTAKLVFNAGLLALLLGALLVYASFRLLRAGFAKDTGQPVRQAGFGVLAAVVVLVKAVAAQQRNVSP